MKMDQKYDAPAIQSNSPLRITTALDGKALAIQGLPHDIEAVIVDLSIESAVGGWLELALSTSELEGYSVYLIDHVLNTSVDLLSDVYPFEMKTKKDNTRFQLAISRRDVLIRQEVTTKDCRIFVTNDLLKFQLADQVERAAIHILDIGGKRRQTYADISLRHGEGQVDFNLNGLFIIKIITMEGVIIRKIITHD
jgi:hypothetical protein